MKADKTTKLIFQERLRYAMRSAQRKITQCELAEACGTTQTAVSNYVAGERLPRVHTFLRIAQFFGKPMEWFFESPESQRHCDIDFIRKVELAVRRLPQETKEAA